MKILLPAWFLSATLVGLTGIIKNAPAPVYGMTVGILTAIVLIAYFRSRRLMDFIHTIPLRSLIAVHGIRLIGIYFIYLFSKKQLPFAFAIPGGIGDILIACFALVLVISGFSRSKINWNRILIWNTLGLIDILFALQTAIRLGLKDMRQMDPLTHLPLILLPTFLVPILLSTHGIIFYRVAKKIP